MWVAGTRDPTALWRRKAPDVDAMYDRLILLMGAIETRFRDTSYPFWADWVRQCRLEIERGDGHGLTRFEQAFGGMGSLNDVLMDEETRAMVNEAYFSRAGSAESSTGTIERRRSLAALVCAGSATPPTRLNAGWDSRGSTLVPRWTVHDPTAASRSESNCQPPRRQRPRVDHSPDHSLPRPASRQCG